MEKIPAQENTFCSYHLILKFQLQVDFFFLCWLTAQITWEIPQGTLHELPVIYTFIGITVSGLYTKSKFLKRAGQRQTRSPESASVCACLCVLKNHWQRRKKNCTLSMFLALCLIFYVISVNQLNSPMKCIFLFYCLSFMGEETEIINGN